eukprot:1681269-Pyramimonas_sp.AAC.1
MSARDVELLEEIERPRTRTLCAKEACFLQESRANVIEHCSGKTGSKHRRIERPCHTARECFESLHRLTALMPFTHLTLPRNGYHGVRPL